MSFTPTQTTEIERLRTAIRRARATGLFLVADSDALCLRITTHEAQQDMEDLRTAPQSIALDGGCGGALAQRRTGNGSG